MLFYVQIVSLIYQSVSLSWKTVVWNVGWVFANTKRIFGYNFVAPLRELIPAGIKFPKFSELCLDSRNLVSKQFVNDCSNFINTGSVAGFDDILRTAFI